MSEIYVFHQFSAVVVSQKVYCNVSGLCVRAVFRSRNVQLKYKFQ